MIMLDANMVTELMRPASSPDVLAWMDEQPPRRLFVTAITEAEARTGVALLPAGARRQVRDRRVLGLAGRSTSQSGCQIVAIAHSQGMSATTRNVRDFSETGIGVIDPWATI